MLYRLLLMTIVLCSDAYASTEDSIPPLRRWVWETLSEAQVAFEAKNFVGGESTLDALRDADEQLRSEKENDPRILNSYELANVYNLYGYASYAQGDNEKALLNYERVIAQPDIPHAMFLNTLFTAGQLHFGLKQWEAGIEKLELWLSLHGKPNPGAYALIGQGYSNLQQFDQAAAKFEHAIAMSESAGNPPKQAWYEGAERAYRETGFYRRANELASERTLIYPDSGAGILPDVKKKPVAKVVVAPIWPESASAIEGHCEVFYSLTPKGELYDLFTGDCQPQGVFEDSSLSAMKKFQFRSYEGSVQEYQLENLVNVFTFSKENINKKRP
jgi:tetratricopeptide (TPR) repeat protein